MSFFLFLPGAIWRREMILHGLMVLQYNSATIILYQIVIVLRYGALASQRHGTIA